MKIIIPLEYSKMYGGMLHSVQSIVEGIASEFDVVVIAPEKSEVKAAMESAGARVIETRGLPEWIFDKKNLFKSYLTFKKVRQLIIKELTPDSIILTNNVGSEIICGGFIPINAKRIFVSRGGDYNGLIGYLIRSSMKSASLFVAVSEKQKEVLIKSGIHAKRIVNIPNGVDVALYSSSTRPGWYKQDATNISIVGYPSILKNQELAIRAIQILKDQFKIKLNIIGSPGCQENIDYLRKLRSLCKELDLEEHVQFLEFIHDKNEIYRGTDILLSTSLREGFGRTLIEGMAAKVPVIAMAIAGGPSSIIDNNKNGILLEANDPYELSESLKKLIVNPAFAQQLAEGGYSKVLMEFSKNIIIEKYVDQFKKCLNE